jgi:hypothetical protein
MFEKTPAGAMMADIARQVVDRLLKALPDQGKAGADLLALQDQVLHQGFSLGLYDEQERGASCVVVLKGLGREDARGQAGRVGRLVTRAISKGDGQAAETCRVRGRELYRAKDLAAKVAMDEAPDAPDAAKATPEAAANALACWFEGDDLVVVAGPTAPKAEGAKDDAPAPLPLRVAAVIDTIEGEASSVAVLPGRAAALAEGRDIPGFESDGLFFVEVAKAKGLYARLGQLIDGLIGTHDDKYEGLILPAGKSMPDDVKFFAPGPDFPFANTKAATQRARLRALGIDPPEESTPAAGIPPAVASIPEPPQELPARAPTLPQAGTPGTKDSGADPAVSKAAMIPTPIPEAKKAKKKASADLFVGSGLDGVTRIVGRWGFQGNALLTDVRVEAPRPRRGLVGVLDQPGFRKDRLPPIPRGSGAFLIGSCDPVKAYDEFILPWIKGLDSGDPGKAGFEVSHGLELVVFELTGQRLHEDLLGHFGPHWCLYSEPGPKAGANDTSMPTLLVGIDDAKAFGKVLDSLARRVNENLRTLLQGDDEKPSGEPPIFLLERLPAPERGYRLGSPSGIVSWLGKGQQPTIMVGESHVAFAASPAKARAALAMASRPMEQWAPEGELARAFECLPAEISSLSVGNPGDSSWPEMIASLPKLVQHLTSAFEVVEDELPGPSVGAKLLGMMGVPQAGGFRLRVDTAKVPEPDALRAHLFPSVLATAADDQGFRLISREAIPFACVGPRFRYSANSKDGEAIAIELRPFLFPCFYAEMRHSLKKDGGKFAFGMRGKFAPNEGSND